MFSSGGVVKQAMQLEQAQIPMSWVNENERIVE